MTIELHPSLLPGLAALLVPLLGRDAGRVLAVVAPAAAAALLALLPDGAQRDASFLGLTLMPLRVDALGRIFALAFALYGALAGFYAWSERRAAVREGGLVLVAGGVGLALAGDLLTLFLFWEMLAVASAVLIACSDRPGARRAAERYFLLHAAGGACLLGGLLLRLDGPGLAFGPLGLEDTSGWLILAAFSMNAAMPPLHAWLPDAYPTAAPAGTAYLSAFTTKGAVLALARGYAGEEILVWAGVGMALYGVVFAVLENDIRRLLAYHIVSQVGYMVCGVGLGTAMAVDGAAAHAFSHIFYKGLLLMGAGAVLAATGTSKLSALGGLAPRLKLVLVLMLVGAASISGVPLFNGFVSKSMVVSAADAAGRPGVELLLIVASMGTFLHTGLKLPYFVFFGPKRAPETLVPVPRTMTAAMILAAGACLAPGLAPGLLYGLLPEGGGGYRPYTADHVVGALQLLAATALGFWMLRRMLGGEPTRTADVDRLYRRPIAGLAALGGAALDAGRRIRERLAGTTGGLLRVTEGEGLGLAPQVAWVVAAAAAMVLAVRIFGGNGT